MKTPGIYICKTNGKIWLVDKIEHVTQEELTDKSFGSFSIIVSGCVDGKQEIDRCLIKKSQFKLFQKIGRL